jgi:hypothetical protein
MNSPPGLRTIATFGREADILGATSAVRARGLFVCDVYTPYAVHGLDQAMGLRRSRLPWVAFAFGLCGAGCMFWFQHWTSSIDWAINVGGKPFNSLPAFVPIIFEMMVLFAGLGVVAAFLVRSRLYPGKRTRPIAPGVTNDRFALVFEDRDAYLPESEVHALLEQFGALTIDAQVVPAEASPCA